MDMVGGRFSGAGLSSLADYYPSQSRSQPQSMDYAPPQEEPQEDQYQVDPNADPGEGLTAARQHVAQVMGSSQRFPDQGAFISAMMPHAMAVSQSTGIDPRLIIAQSALETGYGRAAPGNNYFGIKGPGQVLATNEAGPGGMYSTRDSFRTYGDMGTSVRDYANLISGNPRYAGVMRAQGLDAQIDAMGRSGYATDPNYAAKLRAIASGIPSFALGGQVAMLGDVIEGDRPDTEGETYESLGPVEGSDRRVPADFDAYEKQLLDPTPSVPKAYTTLPREEDMDKSLKQKELWRRRKKREVPISWR